METEIQEARAKLAARFANTQIGGKGKPSTLGYFRLDYIRVSNPLYR